MTSKGKDSPTLLYRTHLALQGLSASELQRLTSLTETGVQQLVEAGEIEVAGLTSEFRVLEPGEVDEPVYVLMKK